VAFRYREAFSDVEGIRSMPQADYGLHTNWLSCFLIDQQTFGHSRDELIGILDAAGVESRPVWKPMHMQGLYQGCPRYGGAVAEQLFALGICLPSSSSLTPQEHDYVVHVVRQAAGMSAVSNTATAMVG
jgi:pyridoxal phosphate-dependent aminotransferase EpsN